MAIQTINIGTNPNDGTGDDLRTAFDKVNDNFTELLAVGGETNTASNLGIGEGVFKVKTAQNLEFKSLRNSDGTIALTSDGNSVYINTTNLADNDFGAIQVDNGDTLTASSSGQLVGIKGGNANIVVTKSGNDIVITGAFEVGDDATPQLGGDLSILGNSIIGGSGSTITSIGSIDSDSMNTDNLTVNTNAIITGTSQFGGLITANGGLTLGSGQTISGNINGGIQGQLTGTLDTNAQTISGDGKVIIDTADISVQGQLGSEFGVAYRTKPSPLTVQTSVDLPVDLITVTSFRNIALNALNVETVVNKALSGGQTYTTGAGSTISFTINDSDNNSLGLGAVGASIVDATVNQVALLPFETGRPPASQPVYFTFNSSGVATLNDIEISEIGIKTNVSNKNLTLDANGTGTVDFYNAYQFPRTIGNAGEVLVVPVSGTELAWGAGGGGGGGSSTFVGLTDTPASYAGSAADAGKFVRVASSGTALEFVTLDGDFTGSVFGDDSTLLVDGNNNKIVGNIDTASLTVSSTNVAIGNSAGLTGQNGFAIAIGTSAGLTNQSTKAVAIGDSAGATTQSDYAIAVGNNAGNTTQGNSAIAIGRLAGSTSQGANTVAIGYTAGKTSQGDEAIAIGDDAGEVGQGTGAVAIGDEAGQTNQGIRSIAIGMQAGETTQADYAVAIGYEAGMTNQAANSIVINASGATLDNTTANSLRIKPIRSAVGTTILMYDATSGEITHTASPSITGDITGSVFGDDSTLLVDGVANKVSLTNNTTDNLPEGSTNLYFTNTKVDARVTQSFVNALGITATSTVGTVDGDLTGSVFADDSTLIVDSINNTITTTKADVGSLTLAGTQISIPSGNTLQITSQGAGHIHLDGDVRIDGTLSHISNQVLNIAGTASAQTIDTTSNNTFVSTGDWTAVGADQAYGNLGAGSVDGQMKTIKVVSRGQFSVNGGATFVDRYLIVNLTINGSVGTLNVSQNSEYGAVTLVWYNSSWWIVSQFDS